MAIAISKDISCNALNIQTDLEIIWLLCHATPETVLIGACYRPPHSTPDFASKLNDTLNDLTTAYPNARILLFGDFNHPLIDWVNQVTLTSGEPEAHDFLDVCLNFNLTQLVTEPTRVTQTCANTLDLILTNHPDSLSSITYLPEISDHKVIHAEFTFKPVSRQKSKKTIRLYDKGNYTAIIDELRSFFPSFESFFQNRSVQDSWKLFADKVDYLVRKHIPTFNFQTDTQKPWFTKTLKRLENKKKRLFRSAKQKGSQCAWEKYYVAEHDYLGKICEAKHSFYNYNLPTILKSDPRKFFEIINPHPTQSTNFTDDAGRPVSDVDCANIFNSAFGSVFTKETDLSFYMPTSTIELLMPPITFSVSGIISIINNLKLSSSAGVDNINSKFLKNTVDVCAEYLCLLFSQSLVTGQLPDDWKKGKVIPVFKAGNKNSPLNYRPISLTSVPCKIMEHVIFTHIISFLDKVNFFHPAQHGFRKGFSCETQLALFVHDLHSNLDNNLQTDAIFLDFTKAFDKVPHKRLLLKLSHLNLHPAVLIWIQEFLHNRSQSVLVNDQLSNFIPVTSGVPQGSVLGPLLFLIYINDLPTNLTCNIRMFADDCVLYHTVTNVSDQISLQSDINQVQRWCERWQMELNPNKCKLVSFQRRHNPLTTSYVISNTPVQLVQSYKYLGLTLCSDLTWAEHIRTIIAAANRTLGFLKRHLRNTPRHVKLLAYQSLVRSKLEYASSIWSPQHAYLIAALESLQNRATRFIHSSYAYHISVSSLKEEIGLSPLSSRRRIATLCLFHKLFHSPLAIEPYISPPFRRSYRIGHVFQVARQRSRTVTFAASFFLRAAKDWNDLPHHIAAITCPSTFMHSVTSHFSS